MKKAVWLALALAILLTAPAVLAVVYSPETPVPPPEIEEIIEDHQTTYRLTIYYIYEDGTVAAPTYTKQLDAGEEYHVSSPVIPDYTPSMETVDGVMPARDVEYTVIYVTGSDPFKTIEEDEPVWGAAFINVGICVE